jgi:hypothetical protein
MILGDKRDIVRNVTSVAFRSSSYWRNEGPKPEAGGCATQSEDKFWIFERNGWVMKKPENQCTDRHSWTIGRHSAYLSISCNHHRQSPISIFVLISRIFLLRVITRNSFHCLHRCSMTTTVTRSSITVMVVLRNRRMNPWRENIREMRQRWRSGVVHGDYRISTNQPGETRSLLRTMVPRFSISSISKIYLPCSFFLILLCLTFLYLSQSIAKFMLFWFVLTSWVNIVRHWYIA